MNTLNIDDIKKIELEILKDVTDFCESNGITYFLACGTALGAVRHNGFIPWDDDIDVAMPRRDYNRFIHSYKSEAYDLLALEFFEKYPYPFAKVSDKKTCLIENIAIPFPMGVYIDIFPMDGLPSNLHMQKKHLRAIRNDARILAWKRISPNVNVGFFHKIVQIIAKILLIPIPISVLVKKYDFDVKKYSYDTSEYVGHLVTKAKWGSDIKPKSIFDSSVLHIFERYYFRIPIDYHNYLSIEYGNYTVLPPNEKQICTHDFYVEWKMNNEN